MNAGRLIPNFRGGGTESNLRLGKPLNRQKDEKQNNNKIITVIKCTDINVMWWEVVGHIQLVLKW
jgi:hypothetical protein